MQNHMPTRARRKRVADAFPAAMHIKPRGNAPQKIVAPPAGGATMIDRAQQWLAVRATLMATLARLLARLRLTALLLLAGLLSAAALLLAALARARIVLLLLVRVLLVRIIHLTQLLEGSRDCPPPDHQCGGVNKVAAQNGGFIPIATAISYNNQCKFCQIRLLLIKFVSCSFRAGRNELTTACKRDRDRPAPDRSGRRAPLRPR